MNINTIKQLRETTGAGVMDVRKALGEAENDVDKAKEILQQKGLEKAERKSERVADAGVVHAYIHGNGQIGVLLEINCETDFVAKTDDFQNLATEMALQVASMSPASVEDLLQQEYIRDSRKVVADLVKEVTAKTGEKVAVRRFVRYEVGKGN